MSILFDIIPAKHRRLVYSLATLALAVYGFWEVSQGDIKIFLTSLASAIVTALAASNTAPVGAEAEPGGEDPEDDDDGDETVADVLDPNYPEHDESAVDAEYPNSDTLYQPGEQPFERFGTQDDFVETNDALTYDNSPEANEIRQGLLDAGLQAVDEDGNPLVSRNAPTAGDEGAVWYNDDLDEQR